MGHNFDGVNRYPVVKTYELTEPDFMWIMDESELMQELGLEDEQLVRFYITDIRLMDKNGEDITDEYKDESMTASWGAGKGTAELFLLYVYMGIVAALGIVFIRYFLRRD